MNPFRPPVHDYAPPYDGVIGPVTVDGVTYEVALTATSRVLIEPPPFGLTYWSWSDDARVHALGATESLESKATVERLEAVLTETLRVILKAPRTKRSAWGWVQATANAFFKSPGSKK